MIYISYRRTCYFRSIKKIIHCTYYLFFGHFGQFIYLLLFICYYYYYYYLSIIYLFLIYLLVPREVINGVAPGNMSYQDTDEPCGKNGGEYLATFWVSCDINT